MSDREIPRVRKAGLPNAARFVLRGSALDSESLRRDARRFHRRYAAWGRYGISAFYATSEGEVDALCETKLVHFSTVVIFDRTDLEAAGIEIVPTFRTPHVTLAANDLDDFVERLLVCDRTDRLNPYHVRENQ